MKDFFKLHKENMEHNGFWTEEYNNLIISFIENGYKKEILKDYYISDVIKKEDKFLIKWKKRNKSLSKEELENKYGK